MLKGQQTLKRERKYNGVEGRKENNHSEKSSRTSFNLLYKTKLKRALLSDIKIKRTRPKIKTI